MRQSHSIQTDSPKWIGKCRLWDANDEQFPICPLHCLFHERYPKSLQIRESIKNHAFFGGCSPDSADFISGWTQINDIQNLDLFLAHMPTNICLAMLGWNVVFWSVKLDFYNSGIWSQKSIYNLKFIRFWRNIRLFVTQPSWSNVNKSNAEGKIWRKTDLKASGREDGHIGGQRHPRGEEGEERRGLLDGRDLREPVLRARRLEAAPHREAYVVYRCKGHHTWTAFSRLTEKQTRLHISLDKNTEKQQINQNLHPLLFQPFLLVNPRLNVFDYCALSGGIRR